MAIKYVVQLYHGSRHLHTPPSPPPSPSSSPCCCWLHGHRNIEASLEAFAASEGKSCVEVMQAVEAVSSQHKMAAKNLDMLLAATGYDKVVS